MKTTHPIFLTGILCLFLSSAFSQFNVNNRIVFVANMNGQQEAPPVTTDARGLATFNLSPDLETLTIHGVFSGLSGPITGCHIHNGLPGVSGGVFLGLTDSISGNELHAILAPPAGFIQKGLEYKLYLNVHTAAHPDGEIRGQLEVETGEHRIGYLDGVQAVPSVSTQASGVLSLFYQPADFSAQYKIILNGLSGPVTGIDIMDAPIGTSGPVILSLNASNPSIGEIDLTSVPPDFTSKLESFGLSVNVKTAAHPSGEIKGQIGPLRPVSFEGFLNGDQVNPPVGTNAQGLAVAKLSSDLDSLHYFVEVTGLTPNNANIHLGAPSTTGPIIGFMSPSSLPNFYFGAIQLSLDEAVKILNGEGYVNISTNANPDGEIRCNLQPMLRQCFTFDLCGDQEVPPSGSDAVGAAVISVDYLNTHLLYRYIVDGLSGPATGAQLQEAAFGANGSLLAPLFLPNPFGSGQFEVDGNFVVKLQSDNTCLNILTEDFPNGEIRGQVRKSLSCDEISGIYDPIVSNLSLFPNPATGSISLEFFAERSTHSSIEILDLTGKPVQVFNRHFSAGEQSLTIDLKGLSAGLYVLRFWTEEGMSVQKFLKM